MGSPSNVGILSGGSFTVFCSFTSELSSALTLFNNKLKFMLLLSVFNFKLLISVFLFNLKLFSLLHLFTAMLLYE